MTDIEEFGVVIVGGGPVGLTASIMLSRLGVRHALFERHPGTSIHPKAIGLNQRTIEVFRSLGIEDDVRQAAAPPRTYERTAWYTSFAGPTELHGRRIAVRDAWGGGRYAEEYARVSPCRYTMLPQIRLEPILRRHAETSPLAEICFDSPVTAVSSRADHVDVTVAGRRKVRADYLIGADGGRTVADQLGVAMAGPTDLLDMVSAHFTADLSPYLPDDGCLINWFVNPDFGGSIGSGYLYHLGPWDARGVSKEWVFACAFGPDDPERFDERGMVARIHRSLGLPDLQIDLHSISHWYIRSVVAERFRQDRCFLVGDAAHSIPPWGALGLNTGIQDVHNLAWKLAAAVRSPELEPLLHSFEVERRPVALAVAENSLANFRNHGGVVDTALGLGPATPPEQGWAALAELWSDGPAGDRKRAALNRAVTVLDKEFHAHGAENGFRYPAGAPAPEAANGRGPLPADTLVHHPTTAPGHHLPHTWLTTPDRRRSTLDLPAPGRLLLVVDEHAPRWRDAVARVRHPLAALVDVVAVGADHPIRPVDGRWEALREVDGSGALLVRPDSIIAWRCTELPAEPAQALDTAVRGLLTADPER
ncbi:FAD-dependent monooxygenase [Pseudonocardia parietis]|uniref:2,4-dichlorophenol 6-monooxygenase n=1 Tax=Pseudonocardia parietis TaxID=570936 RepID=A0ABS4VMM9_9PSEU|nr:FAD-dependent monooxygenase [Pseudonocardia parietis]MBP2365180.1 2,4-dichlorophenol 6-monooxygenase [Pseudonocardia parietis]